MAASDQVKDLRGLLWSSIDNDTSRDLDQIEYAEKLPNGDIRVLVGIADVDASVPKGTPLDQHAARETTSVYTGVRIFPMLPDALSTDITSLLEAGDRMAFVVEYTVNAGGDVAASSLYRALVRNHAQLSLQLGRRMAGIQGRRTSESGGITGIAGAVEAAE